VLFSKVKSVLSFEYSLHRSDWGSLKQDSSSTDYAVIRNVQCSVQAAPSASEERGECASVLAALSFALYWLI